MDKCVCDLVECLFMISRGGKGEETRLELEKINLYFCMFAWAKALIAVD